jgi:hypothetical protein
MPGAGTTDYRRCHYWVRHVLDAPEKWLCMICDICGELDKLKGLLLPLRAGERKRKLTRALLADPEMPESQKRWLVEQTKVQRIQHDQVMRVWRTRQGRQKKLKRSSTPSSRVFIATSFTEYVSDEQRKRIVAARKKNAKKQAEKARARKNLPITRATKETWKEWDQQLLVSSTVVPETTTTTTAATTTVTASNTPMETDLECKEDESSMWLATIHLPPPVTPSFIGTDTTLPLHTDKEEQHVIVPEEKKKKMKPQDPAFATPRWSTFYTLGASSSPSCYRAHSTPSILSFISATAITTTGPEPPLVLAHPMITDGTFPPALLLPPSSSSSEEEALNQRAFKPNSPYKPCPVTISVL